MDLELRKSLMERMEHLERQNRRMRRSLAYLSGAAGLALLAAFLGPSTFSCNAGNSPGSVSELLRAKRIEIVNEEGAAVVVLGTDARGWGKATTLRADQTQLVQIAATDDGGVLAVAGSGGQLRAALGVAKEGYGSVFTFDSKNQRLIAFGRAPLGDGAVFSYDRTGSIKKMWP